MDRSSLKPSVGCGLLFCWAVFCLCLAESFQLDVKEHYAMNIHQNLCSSKQCWWGPSSCRVNTWRSQAKDSLDSWIYCPLSDQNDKASLWYVDVRANNQVELSQNPQTLLVGTT